MKTECITRIFDIKRHLRVTSATLPRRLMFDFLSQQGNKPLMERYRRQKINRYLEELKWLVLTGLNKEVRERKIERSNSLQNRRIYRHKKNKLTFLANELAMMLKLREQSCRFDNRRNSLR